jgi:hypothetical protein
MAVPITATAGAATQATAAISTPVTGGGLPQSLDPLAIFAAPPVLEPPDLLGEVPPFEQSSYEIQAVLGVVANELARIEAAQQALVTNFFPASADALLPIFESLLGLPVAPPGQGVAQRQSVVLAYMQRLKSGGRGLDWVNALSALAGASFTYQEHLTSPVTNFVPNPSFEYDTSGSAPAAWSQALFSGGLISTFLVQTGWASVGAKSLRLTGTVPQSGGQIGPVWPASATTLAVQPSTPYALSFAVNMLTLPAGVNAYPQLNFFTSAGTYISSLAGTGAGGRLSGAPGITRLTVSGTSPTNAAYATLQFSINNSNAASGTLTVDGYIDAASFAQGSFVAYFDGDTAVSPGQPAYGWSGTPGNSTSIVTSPPANTVLVKIPTALAGVGWPYIRDITPAHVAINQGYTDGFFVGITNIGSNL